MMGRTCGSRIGSPSSEKPVRIFLLASSGATEERSPVNERSPSSTQVSTAMVALRLVAEARKRPSADWWGFFSPERSVRSPSVLL